MQAATEQDEHTHGIAWGWLGVMKERWLEFIDPDWRCIHLAITALFIMPKWIIPCSARGCNFCLCCYFVPSTFFFCNPSIAYAGKFSEALVSSLPMENICMEEFCGNKAYGWGSSCICVPIYPSIMYLIHRLLLLHRLKRTEFSWSHN